ncbi:MAG: hypothetical protein ABI613_06940 [Gemmatimonadota bacterium]
MSVDNDRLARKPSPKPAYLGSTGGGGEEGQRDGAGGGQEAQGKGSGFRSGGDDWTTGKVTQEQVQGSGCKRASRMHVKRDSPKSQVTVVCTLHLFELRSAPCTLHLARYLTTEAFR